TVRAHRGRHAGRSLPRRPGGAGLRAGRQHRRPRPAVTDGPYYRADLARAHHGGFGFHADHCAPGILALLRPVLASHGIGVDLGRGTGLVPRSLTAAARRVGAPAAPPAMLDLARSHAPGAESIVPLVLPDDAIPPADAVVSIGHVLSYLPDRNAVDRALVAA